MGLKKKFFFVFGLVALLGLLVFYFFNQTDNRSFLSPLGPPLPKPLAKYAFEALREREYKGSEIKLEKIIKEEEAYTSWLFSYQADGKRITGMANVPAPRSPTGGRGVVVMLRGYIDNETYFTGAGTWKVAGVLAENGFVTLAPDFLGFGGSDSSNGDILEARFSRPVEVLYLLASLQNLSQVDPKKVAFWAHSNGGQIALSVLEICRQSIPTTLWAPVTKGFPDSVLAFMGEMDDQGHKVKKAIDKFVRDYNAKNYSIGQYFADITAPLQVHQGLVDNLIPEKWTADFVAKMNILAKDITYFTYPQGDHNLKSDWDQVVERDVKFFQKHFNE